MNANPLKQPRRFPALAGIPLLAGTCWLWETAQAGLAPFLLALPASGGLLAGGLALLLWAGDRRISQIVALAGGVGTLAFPLLALGLGAGAAFWLSLLAGASALAAASLAIDLTPPIEDVPRPEPGLGLSASVAMDEMVLGLEQLSMSIPSGDAAHQMADEVDAALALYRDRGWLDRPLDYHRDPPPLTAPKIEGARTGRLHYEHLEFESLYEPHAEEPGRARWLAYAPPRTAHAYMLRHPEPGRPWLVCTNGYRMGLPAIDLRAFAHYHQLLGLNVLVPVLPLHGPRRIGRRSGDGFLGGQVMDTVYGEAQAVWDIRRMIGWLRDDGAETIGATGLSLGGYTTALMASVEPGLACVVAGIPATDLARIFWHHGPPLQLESLGGLGITPTRITELMRVVSPLALAPRVPLEGRMIFGGTADRLVTPDHIRDLERHWEHPTTVWYAGGHLSFRMDSRIRHAVEGHLREAKLCP